MLKKSKYRLQFSASYRAMTIAAVSEIYLIDCHKRQVAARIAAARK